MKKKSTKLVLTVETLRTLDQRSLVHVAGGDRPSSPGASCPDTWLLQNRER